MKIVTLLVLGLLLEITAFSQRADNPGEVTPSIAKQIVRQVNNEANSLKAGLKPDDGSGASIEFTLDTFKIERYQKLYMDYNWSDIGLTTATLDAATKYDSLLNKYYKKLLAVLEPKGRRALIDAERSWVLFRGKELALTYTINEEKYGGGSIQQFIYASEYYELIKDRAIAIYNNYDLATQP